jgi:hypothetical protein
MDKKRLNRMIARIRGHREHDWTSLNATEQTIMEHANALREVNRLSGDAIFTLVSSPGLDWIQSLEMLKFVSLEDPKDWKDTVELLESVQRARIPYSQNMLTNIKNFAYENSIPFKWAVSMFTTQKHSKPIKPQFHINTNGV